MGNCFSDNPRLNSRNVVEVEQVVESCVLDFVICLPPNNLQFTKRALYSGSFKYGLSTWSVYMNETEPDHISLFVEKRGSECLEVKYLVKVKNQLSWRGDDHMVTTNKLQDQPIRKFKETSDKWGYPKFISKLQLFSVQKGFVVDGKIFVQIDMEIIRNQKIRDKTIENHWKLSSKYLFNASTSDFTIFVNGICVPAHKFVLMLHSPVFEAMFSNHNMAECVSNKLIIDEFSESSVRSMLRCLYDPHKMLNEVEKHSEDLFRIAHKYDMNCILLVAEEYLAKHITETTAIALLQLGDKYSNKIIKNAAMKFLASRFFTILNTREKCVSIQSELWDELVRYMQKNEIPVSQCIVQANNTA